MRKVLLVTALVWSVLSVLTFITYLNVVSRPITSSMRTLHLDSCELPCWVGIIPGKTTLDEARELIRDTFSASGLEADTVYMVPSDAVKVTPTVYESPTVVWLKPQENADLTRFRVIVPQQGAFTVNISSTNNLVQQIGFSFYPVPDGLPQFTPRLRDILEANGLPTCTDYYFGDMVDRMSLYYQNGDGTNRIFMFTLRDDNFMMGQLISLNPRLQDFESNSDRSCQVNHPYDMAMLGHYVR